MGEVSVAWGLSPSWVGHAQFSFGLVKSVFNLPDGQLMFFEEFEL